MNPIYIVLPLIVLLTYALGLGLKLDDFRMLVRRPLPMLIGLTGQLVVLPTVAFMLAMAFELPAVFFIGVVLIACCPGGSSSNIFTYIARGDVALSVAMTAVSSLVTIVTIPFIMALCVDYISALGQDDFMYAKVTLPVGNLLLQNIVLMLLPVILGILTRHFFYNFSQKLNAILSKIAFPSLILIVSIFFMKHYENIASYLDRLGLCILSLVVLAMLIATLMSYLIRFNTTVRRTIVIEVAMQNAAQAIAIASSPFVFNSEIMTVPAIIYALIMNVVLIIYVAVLLGLHRPKTEAVCR